MNIKHIIALSVFTCMLYTIGAAQDTVRRAVTLPAVSVIQTNSRPETIKAQTPTQVATSEKIERLGDGQLSDVLRRMVGVTLKDYGGLGGIKTVSARGLGSQFSTLTIDGVAVTDCQNGQVDLGRYMLGNSSYISLSNGQMDNTLNAARSFSSGSIINMETHEPEFGTRPFNLRAGIEGGSFGLLSPTLSYEQRLGRKMSLSLWGNYLRSEGNYPFTLYYTPGRSDSCSREVRQNSQVRMGTADMNFFYRVNSSGRLHVKAHYMKGYHALPGPVIYYTVKGSEHSEEQLFFSQARYRHTGACWDWQLLAKYQSTEDIYEDTAVHSIGVLHNEYNQQETYLSQTVRFHTGDGNQDHFSLSFSADEAVNHLVSNLNQHNQVRRLSALGVLSAEYLFHQLPTPSVHASMPTSLAPGFVTMNWPLSLIPMYACRLMWESLGQCTISLCVTSLRITTACPILMSYTTILSATICARRKHGSTISVSPTIATPSALARPSKRILPHSTCTTTV